MTAMSMNSSGKRRRHRHRSYQRKVAGSLSLVFITPFVLFVILALSVQAIEYESIARPELSEVSGMDQYATLREVISTSVLAGRPYSR